ncbi:hypothetical protein PIROE2DRAFT_65831 [Piromyces sp. E2]|nr:hypothetical protein PIROE2DRAFT_65831 [Piromyces sp. E2]|eukprot:OUM69270.1 hypothetical protein PIROE2DRAFT_65831 [Piromyces sp. E2]
MLSSNSPIQLIENSEETFDDSNNSLLSTTTINHAPLYTQNDYSKKVKRNIKTCSPTVSPLDTPINVCYIGAGYVGGSSSAVMAYKCPEDMVTVTVCDISSEKIDAWNSDKLPIYEPGLEDIVKKQRGKNLFYTTDLNAAIDSADIIFISVGTPTKKKGFGAGQAADLKYVENAARKIAQISKNSKIIVEKSTVPCRTAEHINDYNIENGKSSIHFEILSNPEFLSEGTAINDLLYPDRVLIGGLQTKEGHKAQNLLYQLYSYWIPKEKIITMGLWSSELSKLAANALLAQRISSINSLSALCEEVGADIQEVSYACGLDSRIGPKFLNASVGFGGSCFKKDVLNLVYLSNAFKLPEVADYWMQVIKMNEYRKTKFIKSIFNKLFNTISGKEIAIFGFSFKKDTKDTRESAAITVVMTLLQEGATIKLYDPKVTKDQIICDIKENSEPHEVNENISNTIICNTAYDAAYNSDAIVICTEWDEFTSLDYQNIYNNMNKPAFIFDGRLILNHHELKKLLSFHLPPIFFFHDYIP